MFSLAPGLLLGTCRALTTPGVPASPTPAESLPTVTAPVTPPAGPATAAIGGAVWADQCDSNHPVAPACVRGFAGGYLANGLFEAGEAGISNVRVGLGLGACPVAATSVAATDFQGRYVFAGLPAGTYCVSVDPQQDQSASMLPGQWSQPIPAGSVASWTIQVQAGEQRGDVNFGWDFQDAASTARPTATSAAPVPPSSTSTPAPACTLRAQFVSDVTIPDKSYVAPATAFVKTWRVKNSGTCAWNSTYSLVFSGGDQMGGPASVPLPGPVAAGAQIDLSVSLISPAAHGAYQGEWKLRDGQGTLFGIGQSAGPLWVSILVGPTPTPAPSVTPSPSATPAIYNWRGEYYTNTLLSGAPALVRDDAQIDFSWPDGASPAPGLPANDFSVRWTRQVYLSAGQYRFRASVDDGVRVYVDNSLLINDWRDGGRREITATQVLTSGNHSLRVEYYERVGDGVIQFSWQDVSSYPDWRGEYWPNTSLSGASALVRNDPFLDFSWGQGRPDPALPVDNFSARWTRTLTLEVGTYRFYLMMDDGARLYVDDQLVIDEWRGGSTREVTADVALAQGPHSLRVEYYEAISDARLRLIWEKLSAPSFPQWKGEFWPNTSMTGSPVLVRNDADLNFNWHYGSPAVGVPADNFSVRWTRQLAFDSGLYRFSAWSDDGVRLYVDGVRVIDEWHASSGEGAYEVDVPLIGLHTLVVDYYEAGNDALLVLRWSRVGDYPAP